MIHLKVPKNISNDRVLPTYDSDNYFSLLPNESKELTLEFDSKYLDGEKLKIMVEGLNITPLDKDVLVRFKNIRIIPKKVSKYATLTDLKQITVN